MRYSRQNKVLEIIENNEVETQEILCKLLRDAGYDVTQATVSRDIKELQLVKTLAPSGRYKYAQSSDDGPITNRFVKIFKETIMSIVPAENIIVVKTLAGCAQGAAEAIDSLDLEHIVGSVAGDNTIMVIIDNSENTKTVIAKFEELLS